MNIRRNNILFLMLCIVITTNIFSMDKNSEFYQQTIKRAKEAIHYLYLAAQKQNELNDGLAIFGSDVTFPRGVMNPSQRGDSILFIATKYAEQFPIDLVESLIICGAPIDKQDSAGFTPLHGAAYYNNLSVMQILLKNKADITKTDRVDDKTALDWALEGYDSFKDDPKNQSQHQQHPPYYEAVQLLLEHKAVITNKTIELAQKPIMHQQITNLIQEYIHQIK